MRTSILRCALAAALLLSTACDSPTEPSGPQVAVTALRFREPGALIIDFEFKNQTPNTLYLFECGGNVFFLVTVRETTGRTDTWSTICLGIWTVNEIPVTSGAVFRGNLAVGARAGGAYTLSITYSADPNRMSEHQVAQAPTVRWRP